MMKNGPIQLESNWSQNIHLSVNSEWCYEREMGYEGDNMAYQPYGILWLDEGQTTLLTPCYSKTILGSKHPVSRI